MSREERIADETVRVALHHVRTIHPGIVVEVAKPKINANPGEPTALTELVGRVQLILTSPPFVLNKKQAYGNLTGDRYRDWLADVMADLSKLLAPTGSPVVTEQPDVDEDMGVPLLSRCLGASRRPTRVAAN